MRVAFRPLALALASFASFASPLMSPLMSPLVSSLRAQQPAAPAGAIVGVIRDSLAGRPLAEATVQLVAPGPTHEVVRTTRSARDGRFVLDAVPPGRFVLGFLHPVLDTLGIEAPVRAVEVRAGDSVRVDLAVPSARGVRAAACRGNGAVGDPPAALVGTVRDAHDRTPVAGAVVEATWLEYDVARQSVSRRRAGAADTTAADGRFALCDVPRGGALALRARAARDSTAIVELEVPTAGLLRRDLYVGSARATVARVAGAGAAAAKRAGENPLEQALDSVVILTGDGRLQGRVRAGPRGRPLEGVIVGLELGATTRTSASGEWSLAGLPTGTRNLEVRRVGFYPVRIPVDVVPGAPPVEVALAEFEAVLDTVRVRASRWRLQDTGFEERRRSGAGRYLTTTDLLATPVIFTSDVFLRIPGMRVDRTMLGGRALSMRGAFGRCAPAVYIDGMWMRNLAADDIDAFVSPDEVAGIEVYSGAFVPAQFQEGLGGCGSIVIWTKQGENPARRWSLRRRVAHGAVALLVGAGIGVLFARH